VQVNFPLERGSSWQVLGSTESVVMLKQGGGPGFIEELASPPVEVPIHLLLSYERRTDHKFLRLHFRRPKNNSFCFVDEIASCKACQQKRGSSLFDFALLLHTDFPLFAQLGFPFSFPLLGYFSFIF
jgi:hypothetical protein